VKIIKHRERIEKVYYQRCFYWSGQEDLNYGFGFDCDEDGNVDEQKLNPCGLENFKKCLTGSVNGEKIIDRGAVKHIHTYIDPAIGLCNGCGEEVVLYGFTNTCECGLDYNSSGQQLAPRHFWGEETGEHYSDILKIR